MAKRIRARGMNAALAGGEAGVGEMNPARSPMRPRQFGVALAAALVGGGLGMFTYHAVAHSASTYAGQVAPAQTYYLDFAADGTVLSLSVQPGAHVTKGEVLATQDAGVAQANLSAAQAAVSADEAVVAADLSPQAGASEQAADQLSVTQANAAVSAAQSALGLQQNSAQHSISTQTTVVGAAQNAYNTDSAHYASECGGTSSSATPAANASSDASPTPAGSAGAATGSGSTTQQQFCQNLQSTVNRDYTALSSAQAQLADLQSSTQVQAQRDQSNLTQSQAVLTAAQTRQSAAGSPLTPAVVAQAKAALATAQAQVAADQQAVQNTKIVAPAAGIVADTAGAVGDVVGPNGVHGYQGPAEQSGTQSNQQPGFELFVPQGSNSGSTSSQSSYMPLVTLYAGPLNVVAQIPESDMNAVHVGGAATVAVSALGISVPATVRSTALDPVRSSSSTAYYDVTLVLSSADARIMAGMSVQVGLG